MEEQKRRGRVLGLLFWTVDEPTSVKTQAGWTVTALGDLDTLQRVDCM